mmetsp:Transcript_14966/g.33618  ORF Transcript_14966/g.33618 Transcript_14966/m.33618 type:complete len:280 (+) Transcript_14966:138-977(+)
MWSYWFSPQDSNTPATLATATPTPDAATAATAATVTPTPADIHEAAQLVAAAMFHTTSYAEIFRDEESRLEALTFLFECNLRLVAAKCPSAVHICKEEGVVVCVFMLCRTGSGHFTMWEKVVSGGILQLTLRYGWRVLYRLVRTSDFFDAQDGQIMGAAEVGSAEVAAAGTGAVTAPAAAAGAVPPKTGPVPYLLLQRMAVTPLKQGGGVGSRYLGKALEQADREGTRVLLATQEERNLTFYRRRGFEVVKEVQYVPDDPHPAYKSWFMIREPTKINDL